jgi:hypothetical protein
MDFSDIWHIVKNAYIVLLLTIFVFGTTALFFCCLTILGLKLFGGI